MPLSPPIFTKLADTQYIYMEDQMKNV